MKAEERGVRKYFEKVGKVKQVIMIRDKYTNRHKGFAYVEMKDLESIPVCHRRAYGNGRLLPSRGTCRPSPPPPPPLPFIPFAQN